MIDWNTIASIATAFGIIIAAWQIWLGRRQSRLDFEDSFDQRYRDLTMQIPVDALIGDPFPSEDQKRVRELVFNYLDLCNEQVYLRMRKRISKVRWKDWCEGMQSNLEKPAFKEVWDEIQKKAPDEFSHLKELQTHSFKSDPSSW